VTGPGEGELAELLAAAEPTAPKSLGDLVGRLERAGRLVAVERPAGGAEAGVRSGATVGWPAVTGVALDSRRVRAGQVFVAVPGEHVDGRDFASAAVGAGAAAVVVERPLPGLAAPQLVVDRSRAALAVAATWWYEDPSLRLGVVGVTGTDGKTTTSFLATAVLEAAGISTGLLTTAQLRIGHFRSANPEHVTTPEAPRLQQILRAMARAGNEAAVIETTSHGLALERVGGVAYDIGIFTNLTHEHLELHRTLEAYRDAKLSLFLRLGANPKHLARRWPAAAIVNRDDPNAGGFEAAAASAGAVVITYGLAADAAVRATDVAADGRGLRFSVETRRWSGAVALALAGRFNVHNALAAIALGESLELDPDAIRAGLSGVTGVPGRMEPVVCGQPFAVIVDYAHSPASLELVLDQLGPVASRAGGGLIAVFGSAGERDVAKRTMMGRVAGERCRVVVLTDEDPRGEDREAILDEIATGAEAAGKRRGHDLLCIADRRAAIERAFRSARPGDVVLLAGKGHEQSIIMADGPRPWDERSEAVGILRSMGFGDAE
jgi:UDP-N-acetylmuramoyl-L-alanyl-D-glutamate--2,6-diaminopimelate ligase